MLISWVTFWIACSIVCVAVGLIRWGDPADSTMYICVSLVLAIAAALAMMFQ